jgi:hypothetical protein
VNGYKVFIPHGYGLRVYRADTGELIGVDVSFSGNDMGRNILYGDYIITVKDDSEGIGKVCAVYIGE